MFSLLNSRIKYCSVQGDPGIQNRIHFGIQSKCMKDKCEYHIANITTTDIDIDPCIRKSITDGTEKESDAIIHSTFSKHIMLMFNSMITHGYIPSSHY